MIEIYVKVKIGLGKYVSRYGFKIFLLLICCVIMGNIVNFIVLMFIL